MRFSRLCYDKPRRCPSWAGGGCLVDRKGYVCENGYVHTRPRHVRREVLSDGTVLGDYDTDHPGSNQWRFGRCDECGVVTWPFVIRWTSPRFVFGWRLKRWLDEWTWHQYEGYRDLGPTVGPSDSHERVIALGRRYLTRDYYEREVKVVGRFVMREAPDVDNYVVWSTIVDDVVFSGNREETLEHLRDNYRRRYDPAESGSPESDLDRADATGTSVRYRLPGQNGSRGAWTDEALPWDADHVVPRANVFRLVERGPDDDLDDLLTKVSD